jgi:signal peptidase II
VKIGSARYFLLSLVSAATIVLDQVTKAHIMETMRLHESITVVPDFFSITYIRNPGAAFGLLASSSAGFRMMFFALTSIGALILLTMILARLPQHDWAGQLSIAGILGGAIGNLLDRLRLGEVIDFLDFYVKGYHWPAFNVADSAISVGVFFLLLHFASQKQEAGPATEQP